MTRFPGRLHASDLLQFPVIHQMAALHGFYKFGVSAVYPADSGEHLVWLFAVTIRPGKYDQASFKAHFAECSYGNGVGLRLRPAASVHLSPTILETRGMEADA